MMVCFIPAADRSIRSARGVDGIRRRLQTHWNECSVLFHFKINAERQKAPVKRSTKSAAARNDAQLDTRADGVHTARVGDRTADHLNNRIFFRLFQVGNTLQRQAVKELGVTTVQWAVLGALSDPRPKSGIKSGISLSTLADFLVVSRQNLDGVLKRLERDGLVERVMDDGDKRGPRRQADAARIVVLARSREAHLSILRSGGEHVPLRRARCAGALSQLSPARADEGSS